MPKKLLMNNLLAPQVEVTVFAEYTFDNTIDSNCLPTLTIVGGYEVIDEVNGNITRRILRNADENKPTAISFRDKRALVTIDSLIARPTTVSLMFYNCSNLISVNLLGLDTSNVSSMYYMFGGCRALASLDISSLVTSNVTDMTGVFIGCSNLKTLDLTNFNTSKVNNMGEMFKGCGKLSSLNLSSFDTSNVTNMGKMFDNCSELTTLDLSSFNTHKVTNMQGMFYQCRKLATLDVSNFNGSNVTTMSIMFYFCSSLVSLDLSHFNAPKAQDMYYTFGHCNNLSGEILISNPNIASYTDMFNGTSTNPNTKFTVRYTDEATKTMAEKLVATKSSDSNVVLADTPGL